MSGKAPVCGIDFGTSNSTVATAHKGRVQLLPLEGTHTTLPSALFYRKGAPAPFFGREAIDLYLTGGDGRFMRSLKRILGTALIEQTTSINGKSKRFDAIIADFIAELKARAEATCKAPLDSVVMGRPVHFVDGNTAGDQAAQDTLERIAKAAGFTHVAFQFEPIAAAFAHEQKLTKETLALVFDIGGGTSDFTLIRLSPDAARKNTRDGDILANTGIRTGGNDFDKSLSLSSFMPQFGYHTTYGHKKLSLPATPFHDLSEWAKVNFLYTPKIRMDMEVLLRDSHAPELFGRFVEVVEHEWGHKLLAEVEDTKIALSAHSTHTADISFIEKDFAITASADSFNAAVMRHVQNIETSAADCLNMAGLERDAVELIILTGGTTEVPVLKQHIQGMFPRAALSEGDKLGSVGLGLGFDAQRIFGA